MGFSRVEVNPLDILPKTSGFTRKALGVSYLVIQRSLEAIEAEQPPLRRVKKKVASAKPCRTRESTTAGEETAGSRQNNAQDIRAGRTASAGAACPPISNHRLTTGKQRQTTAKPSTAIPPSSLDSTSVLSDVHARTLPSRCSYLDVAGPPGQGLKSSSFNLVCSREFLQSPLPAQRDEDYVALVQKKTLPRKMTQLLSEYSNPLPAVNLAPMRFSCLKGVPGRMTPRGKINRFTDQPLFREENVPYDNLRGKHVPFRTLEYVTDPYNMQLINWKKSTLNPEKFASTQKRVNSYKEKCAKDMEEVEREVEAMNFEQVSEELHRLSYRSAGRTGVNPCRKQEDNRSQIPLRLIDDPTLRTDEATRPYLNHFSTYTTAT
mmetsp:Transcript_37059/g.62381  ORF Transcript_37059/g.62381 Transcript_37059/m.62381 type:complete len:377 (-) Transcript_37059:28-1158(-)